MLGFAGIYTSSIHQRFFEPRADERRLVLVNRMASAVFACVSIAISTLFTDMPSALRFTWQTVPLMGIAWFMAALWPRANRWGAIASFVAAIAATALAKFVLPEFTWLGIRVTWANDAGLPFTVALYMLVGIAAGIVVSLLTPPEDPHRTEHFFLLLKTPIGQEHVLREAGFRQLAGDDTFDLPAADEAAGSPLAAWLPRIDRRESLRQATYGVIAMAAVVVVMLGSVILLAGWMAGRA
jgi:Na+/proline symporter